MHTKSGISTNFSLESNIVVYEGDCLEFLETIPNNSIQLIITSPPYNIGKEYEKRKSLQEYIKIQAEVIEKCVQKLKDEGSICWQVGNYVDNGQIIPLDIVLYPIFEKLNLKLRNRVIWHFEHGLHCSKRLSGRYETLLWFTKSDNYYFNLDPIRILQKYPGKKYFKGDKAGQYSCNPLGKNPGDVWLIPNVKSNHVEKTEHPCQFPVELVERVVLSLSKSNEWVLDPYLGAGSSIIAALLHGRRGAGSELSPKYVDLARQRIKKALSGELKLRPMGKPVFDPKDAGKNLLNAPWLSSDSQIELLEKIS